MTSTDTILECSICFVPINFNNGLRDSIFSKRAICDKCNAHFNDYEKELLIHCFNVARELFYTNNIENYMIKDILYDVLSELILELNPEFSFKNVFNKILLRTKDYGVKFSFKIGINIPENQIRCVICNSQIDLNQSNLCQKCKEMFSSEEIDQMKYIFGKYGGFFHQYKDNLNKIRQIIQYHIEQVEKFGDYSKLIELSEISLHYALLHGISPTDFTVIIKRI
jgi:hypothetical protein